MMPASGIECKEKRKKRRIKGRVGVGRRRRKRDAKVQSDDLRCRWTFILLICKKCGVCNNPTVNQILVGPERRLRYLATVLVPLRPGEALARPAQSP